MPPPRTLIEAAKIGNLEAVRRLQAEVTRRDDLGYTALMLAAESGHSDVVRFLLNFEAEMQGRDGITALMLAAENGHLNCVIALRDIEGHMVDDNGRTAYDYAISQNNFEAANFLVPDISGQRQSVQHLPSCREIAELLRSEDTHGISDDLAFMLTEEYWTEAYSNWDLPNLSLDAKYLICELLRGQKQHYIHTIVDFMYDWTMLRSAIKALGNGSSLYYRTVDRFRCPISFNRARMLERMRDSEDKLAEVLVTMEPMFVITGMRLASHEPEEVSINCHSTHLPLPAFRLRAEVLDVCMNRRPEFLIVSGPAGCGLVPCIPTFLTELIHCQGGPRIVILVQSLNAAVSARPISIVLSSIGGVVPKVGDVEQLVRDALNGQHPDIPKLCLLDYDTAIRLSASFPGIGAVATFILDEAHLCRSDTDILWALLRSRGRIQDTLPSATLLATGPVPDFLNDGRAELFVLDDPSVYTVTSRAVTLPGINALQEVVQRELIDIIARMYTGNVERGDIVVFYPGATGSADLARSFYNSRNGLENTAEWRLAGSARIHPITQLSHGCTSVEDLYGRLRHMCNEMSENQERTTLVIMCVGRDNSSRVIRNFIARALPDDLHKWVLKVVLLPERADSANDFQRVAAVLETGYCEVRILDPITQIPRVGVKPISHAERTLRLGCLGRICAGTAVCIEPLGGLTARPHREIEAEDLVTLVLRTRKQGVLLENIAEALGLARDSVIGAITHLQNIGCLSSRGEIIDYGKRISAVVGLSPDYALLFLEIAGGDEAHAVAFLVLLYAIVIPRLVDPEAARDDAEEFIDKIRGDHAPNDDEIACAGICAFKVDSGIMIPTLRPDGTCIRATSVCLECLEEGLRYYLRKFYPDGETVARLGEYTAIESLTLASQIVISKGNVTPFAASVARFVDHRTCGVLINHWVHVKVGIVLSYRGFFSRCPEHPAVPLIVNPNANEKEMRCECVTPECKLGMHAFCEDWHLKNACLNAKIFKDIRRCPRCKHGVAFIGGCYCMTCICKQIFCWHCGKGFRDTDSAHDHLNAEHGGVFDEKGLIYDDPTS